MSYYLITLQKELFNGERITKMQKTVRIWAKDYASACKIAEIEYSGWKVSVNA